MKEKECIFAREVRNEGNEQKVGPQVGVLVTFLYLLLRARVEIRRVPGFSPRKVKTQTLVNGLIDGARQGRAEVG